MTVRKDGQPSISSPKSPRRLWQSLVPTFKDEGSSFAKMKRLKLKPDYPLSNTDEVKNKKTTYLLLQILVHSLYKIVSLCYRFYVTECNSNEAVVTA